MDLSPASLFTSLVFGGVGYVLFSYGRKANRWPHLVTGIALFAACWAAPSPLACAGIGAGLLAVLWVAVRRLGY